MGMFLPREIKHDSPDAPMVEEFKEIFAAGHEFMVAKGGVRRSRHDAIIEKFRDDPVCVEAIYKLQRILRNKGYYMIDEFYLRRDNLNDPRKKDEEVVEAFHESKF
jgi:hypothetical protein